MYRPPYPADAYLLRTEKRYRWRDAAGRVDLPALALTAKLLPTAPDLTHAQRERLGRVVDRVQKAALSYADLAAAGMLDERFGFPIVVEVPEGGTRRGVSEDGTPWETKFTGASYGFLPDTVARDAEEIDVIAGPRADASNVYIVTFLKPVPENLTSDGAVVDEIKLFIGFGDYESAQACARANWPPERIGSIQTMPIEVLRGLLGFELDEGLVQKAIGMAAHGGLVVTSSSGVVIGRVEKCGPAAKGAITTATFADGGIKLPAQGGEREVNKAPPERYNDIDFSPPEGVREAARRGLALHEEGKSGDGLEPATVAWARRIAEGEAVSPEKARQGAAWMGRNRRFRDEPKDSPAWTSYLLWFGDAGDAWFGKLVEQMDARDKEAGVDKFIDTDVLGADGELVAKTIATAHLCPVEKGLDASTPIDRRIVYGVVLEPEPFGGRGDGHDETYGPDVVRRAAYGWLASFANLNDSHGRFLSKQEIVPVESFIAPVQFSIGGTVIPQGAWVVAAKIVSDVLWGRVLTGELSAWSIEGFATRDCTTCDARMRAKALRDGSKQWLCPNCDRTALLMP
jgi:hypothetical protein